MINDAAYIVTIETENVPPQDCDAQELNDELSELCHSIRTIANNVLRNNPDRVQTPVQLLPILRYANQLLEQTIELNTAPSSMGG